MSSRKLLMYLDGLLVDGQSANGWYAKQVRLDMQEVLVEQQAYQERLQRAEMKAQIEGQPMSMADLQPPQ